MKKVISLFLSILMLLSCVSAAPFSAFADEFITAVNAAKYSPDEFSKELYDLLNEYETPNPFNKMVIDVEENTINTDGSGEKSLEPFGVDMQEAAQSNEYIPSAVIESTLDENEELSDDYIDLKEAQSHGFEAKMSGGKLVITKPFQTRRLIVNLKSGKLNNTFGAVKSIRDSDGMYVLQYESDLFAKNAYYKIKALSNVKSVMPEGVMTVCGVSDNRPAELINSDRYIKYLSDNKKTSKKVTVAVLDTGADVNHELIKYRISKTYNVYTKSSNVSDGNGHGTHVCGIVANNTPSNVKIMPVKVMRNNGSGTYLGIKLGIEYAVKNGADVINMSLGAEVDMDNPITKAIREAVKKNVTVVVAAGNESENTSKFCPAGISECITVASATEFGASTSLFSNYGKTVDITAPGENIESSIPGNQYAQLSGTSMATPFGSAAAAMVILDKGKISPSEVEKTLKSYCADMYVKGNDIYSGAGLINLGIPLGDSHVAETLSCDTQGGYLELDYFKNCSWASVTSSCRSDWQSGMRVVSDTDRSYTVKNSNPNVAQFNGRFVVPKGAGETTITLSMANKYSFSFKVKVNKIEIWTDYAAKKFGGGKGTKKKPYLIKNAKQLAKFSLDLRNGKSFKGKYFKLTKDIDLKGKKWISASYCHRDVNFFGGAIKVDSFKGTFDGNNHKIKNMVVFNDKIMRVWGESNPVNENWYTNYGLFGELEGATVKNLGIENGYTGNFDSGLLCGTIYQGTTVKNCYTSGESHGPGFCGCIFNYDINIINCYSTAISHYSGFAINAYSSMTDKVFIKNCYYAGELLDSNRKSQAFIKQAGFVGSAEANYKNYTNIINCFSSVKSPDGVGFANSNVKGNINYCYYLKGNKKGIKSDNYKKKTKLKAKPLSFFKKKKSYTNSKNWNKKSPWDFKNTWAISKKVNGGLPYLKKNKPKTKGIKTYTGTWLDYKAPSFAGGNGTKNNPYLVSNAAQLARIAWLYRFGGAKGVYFKITNNIDLKAHKWFPIGAGDDPSSHGSGIELIKYPFCGNIDGNGKTITNMTVTGGDDTGFISYLNEGTVKNLSFTGVNVSGLHSVGAVTGGGNESTITNCFVSGTVKGHSTVGGIAGNINNGKVKSCEVTANITADYGMACGISQSVSSISNCYYHSGKISGSEQSIGLSAFTDSIENSLSIGYPLKLGSAGNKIKNSYCIADDIRIYTSYGRSDYGKKVDYSQLKDKETFATFDFTNAWVMKGDYPIPKK